VFLLVKAANEFPQCYRHLQRIWSYVEKSPQTGWFQCRTVPREIDSWPNSLARRIRVAVHSEGGGGALLTMGQRSRSQHRFSLVWRYNAHSWRSAAAVEGQPEDRGDQRSLVSLIFRARIASPPPEMARPDKRSPSSLSGSAVGESVVPLNVARAPIRGLIRHLYVGQAYSAV